MQKKSLKSLKGVFAPTNPEKYIGKNKNQIIYRSSWEKLVMHHMDTSEKEKEWASECVVIPYSFDGKIRRYFTDFFAIMNDGRKLVIEVKPLRETKPPRRTKKKSKKTMLYESHTYAKNTAKWDAARKYCKKRGFEFVIITEKELGI